MFIFHNSGHEEFIKLILLLFCFAQRLSFPCDTQKRENVVTRLKPGLHISRKDRKHKLENMFFKLSSYGLVSMWQ